MVRRILRRATEVWECEVVRIVLPVSLGMGIRLKSRTLRTGPRQLMERSGRIK
jgi:hypothetical protein